MCDFAAGEVLFSFPNDPDVVRMMTSWFEHHGEEEHVRVLDRLDHRLDRVDVPSEARVETPQQVWRIGVPVGQESFKCNYLRQRYHLALSETGAQNSHRFWDLLLDMSVEPNQLLTLASKSAATGHLQLTRTHSDYKALVGADAATGIGSRDRPPKVAIVDSGVTHALDDRVTRRVDLVSPDHHLHADEAEQADVDDKALHGTAVATILADLAPEVELMVYRVADDLGRASEWDVIAALLCMGDADVVNLSLSFGFAGADCGKCGRRANSSRSFVFERTLDLLQSKSNPPIVVAASGNAGKEVLSYPARFSEVVAVASVNSHLEVSQFSNQGALDHLDRQHQRVWFLPGGDNRTGCEEAPVTSDRPGKPLIGTSFACAYATGLIARSLERRTKAEILDCLAEATGVPITGGPPHRHGLLTLAALAG